MLTENSRNNVAIYVITYPVDKTYMNQIAVERRVYESMQVAICEKAMPSP